MGMLEKIDLELFIVNSIGRYIYIADGSNNRIVKWTTNYTAGGICVVGCTGVAGTAATQLNTARDLKFDSSGNLYVSDQGNNRIQKFMIQACSSSEYSHSTIQILSVVIH
jgi:6-phosphogluconolactonase (cycloisomerase 2 family)